MGMGKFDLVAKAIAVRNETVPVEPFCTCSILSFLLSLFIWLSHTHTDTRTHTHTHIHTHTQVSSGTLISQQAPFSSSPGDLHISNEIIVVIGGLIIPLPTTYPSCPPACLSLCLISALVLFLLG